MKNFELYITREKDEFLLDSGIFTKETLKSFFHWMKKKKVVIDKFDYEDSREYISCINGVGYTFRITK